MFEERVKYYREKQEEIMKLNQDLENKKNEYKAEMKAEFGICDGEPADVLSLIAAIKNVVALG